jgi:hypothetical protein
MSNIEYRISNIEYRVHQEFHHTRTRYIHLVLNSHAVIGWPSTMFLHDPLSRSAAIEMDLGFSCIAQSQTNSRALGAMLCEYSATHNPWAERGPFAHEKDLWSGYHSDLTRRPVPATLPKRQPACRNDLIFPAYLHSVCKTSNCNIWLPEPRFANLPSFIILNKQLPIIIYSRGTHNIIWKSHGNPMQVRRLAWDLRTELTHGSHVRHICRQGVAEFSLW